jgi:hypothetical protein
MGDESHAAGIVLVPRVVQALRVDPELRVHG